MQSEKATSVFELLAKPVQKALAEAGFTQPTLPQTMAFPPIFPETASRILGKMHPKEDDFYMDLLKAKIQYLRTREFWEDKKA